jgi:hypothetical protein
VKGKSPARKAYQLVEALSKYTYTVDTGSIGTALPLAQLGPDVIGPGAPALKYYDSSGNKFIGFVYLAPMTFQMGSSQVQTDPVRVLAVVSSACHPGKSCTSAPPFKDFHYLGVGFDRGSTSTADPFKSPRDNALLSVQASSGSPLSEGYILSGSAITAGITVSNSAGSSPVGLMPDPTANGDWLATPGCVSFPTATLTPAPVCGAMLFDMGISGMFITFSSASAEPEPVSGGLSANQMISIDVPTVSAPALTYAFSSGPMPNGTAPPTTGMAPSKVALSAIPGGNHTVFVNTGRHILFENDYEFNAQTGTVAFTPIVPPLR